MTSFRSSTKNNHSKEDVPSNWYRLGLLSKKNKNRESTNFAVGSNSGTTFNVDNNYSRDNTKSLRSRFGGLRGSNENNNFGDSYDYRSRTATPNSNIAPSFHSRSTGDRDLQTGSVTPRPFSNSDSRAPSSMTGMLDMDRARSRRDRTFVGSQCAVCDEPLEHTLRGERIIQFSCGHVSHEACFYEYIKEFDSQVCPECNAPLSLDTSRGGNVLDLGKSSLLSHHDDIQPQSPRRIANHVYLQRKSATLCVLFLWPIHGARLLDNKITNVVATRFIIRGTIISTNLTNLIQITKAYNHTKAFNLINPTKAYKANKATIINTMEDIRIIMEDGKLQLRIQLIDHVMEVAPRA